MDSLGSNRSAQLRQALLDGRALTRLEAQAEFGITGSTFRWTIESMQAKGVQLDHTIEVGRRNAQTKRWFSAAEK